MILNAVDAIGKNGNIFLKVKEKQYKGRGYAVYRISDDGPGIDENLLDRIFEPFFTTKGKGNGLGLSLALSLTQQNGGYLEVKNLKAGGAVFDVAFPLSRLSKKGLVDFDVQSLNE